jgi:hypothetical protein
VHFGVEQAVAGAETVQAGEKRPEDSRELGIPVIDDLVEDEFQRER